GGGGRPKVWAAVVYPRFERPVHVCDGEPEHRPGVPGRTAALDPLADEAGRLEVRVVRLDLPAEDRLVERGRALPVGRRKLQVADLAVGEAGGAGGFGVRWHGFAPCRQLRAGRHSTTKRPDDWVRAAMTSRPAWRASSVNRASVLVLPPATSMSMPSERGASSAATPPRTAMLAGAVLAVLAASAQRRRMATVGSSGQSLSTLLSR